MKELDVKHNTQGYIQIDSQKNGYGTSKILTADEKLFDLQCYCDGIGYDLDNNSEYVRLCTRLIEYIDGSFNTNVIDNIINDIDNLHNSITAEFGGKKK